MCAQCMSCGEDIPTFAETAIEDGELGQVVKHVFDPSDDPIAISETNYYCDPECFSTAFEESGVA